MLLYLDKSHLDGIMMCIEKFILKWEVASDCYHEALTKSNNPAIMVNAFVMLENKMDVYMYIKGKKLCT